MYDREQHDPLIEILKRLETDVPEIVWGRVIKDGNTQKPYYGCDTIMEVDPFGMCDVTVTPNVDYLSMVDVDIANHQEGSGNLSLSYTMGGERWRHAFKKVMVAIDPKV